MTGKKKILILSADAGFGHRSAAEAVAQALEQNFADQCTVRILNPLDAPNTPEFLRESQSDYDRIVKAAPELYKLGFNISDDTFPAAMIETWMTVLLYGVMRDLIEEHQPDVILTTYPLYQAPLTAVFSINDYAIPLLAVVTDLSTVHRTWFHPSTDLCLVPNEGVYKLGEEANMSPERLSITGIPVSPALTEPVADLGTLRQSLGWLPERSTLLAVGSRRVENMLETLDVINHSGFPLQLVLVAGNDEELYTELQGMEWHLPVHLYKFVERMPDFMHAADLLMCKAGGLIVTEALAAGLPMLIIDAIPGQETGNAEIVVEGGAGEMALEPLQALKVLAHWMVDDGALLKERKAQARRLGTPDAARQVAQKVMEMAESGPQTQEPTIGQPLLIELLSRNKVPWQNLLSRAGHKRAKPEEKSALEHD